MYVILSGRVAIVPRDGLGQAVPVAAFAQLIGAPVEEMTDVVPGEVMAEIGQLSGRHDLSVFDARDILDLCLARNPSNDPTPLRRIGDRRSFASGPCG